MLPGTGVYVNRVRLHRRKPTGNGLCPAMAALAQSASKRAGGRGAGKGGRHDDDRNGLLLGLWPLMVLARAALQWQSRELPSEVNFRLGEVRTKGELVTG